MEHTLLDAVVHSEFAYFIIPNYCDRPCANFFLFDERSQCLFQHQPELADAYIQVPKKFLVVSNTEQETFRTLLVSHTIGPPDILFLPASHYGKISIAGDLLSSAQAAADVDAFAQTT